MSNASNAAKSRYNRKAYSRWACDLRNDDFEEIERARQDSGLSRAQFLKYVVSEVYHGLTLSDQSEMIERNRPKNN